MGLPFTVFQQRISLRCLTSYARILPGHHTSRWAVLLCLLLGNILPGQAQIYYIQNDNSATVRGDQLWRINVDGTSSTSIATNFADSPGVLALDKGANKAFVAEARSTVTPKVISVNLSTGTSATVTSFAGGSGCQGLALDPVNQYIYYATDDGSFSTRNDQIRRVSYNGTNDVLIVSNYTDVAGPITIDLANNRLFAIDSRGTAPKILSINLSTSAVTTVLNSTSVVTGITYDSRVNKIYYMVSDGQFATSIDQLRRIDPGTLVNELVLGNFSANAPGNIALDKANNLMIVADVRGTAPEILKVTLSSPTASTVTTLTPTFALRGVAVLPTCTTFVTALTPSPSSAISCTQTSLTLTATGGSSYTFSSSGGGNITSQNTSGSAIINASGTYSVTVTDAEGCTMVSTTTITGNTTPPPVSLSATDVCAGQSVTLTATGGIGSYTFVGDSGVIGSGSTNTTTVSGLTAGPQSFTVRVRSSVNSCTNTAVASASVTASPTPSLLASNTLNCAQTSVTLTASGGVSYTFAGPGGGITSQDQTNGTAVVSAGGTYTVTAANGSGCTSSTTTTVTGSTAAPTLSLTLNNVCVGQGASVSATTGFSSYTFTSPFTSPLVTPASFVHFIPGVTSGSTYTVTAQNSLGCRVTSTVSFTIYALPTPTLSVGPSSTLTCAIPSLTLTASGGVNYTFAGPGVVSSNPTAGTAVVNAGGTYTVTVANATSCVSSTTITLSVDQPLPTPSLAASSTLTCSITSLTLTASGGNSYSFSGPGIVSQNATAGTAVVNADGVYSVTVTNTVTGCSNTTTVTVQSNTAPPGSVSLSASNSGTLTCSITTLTLTASATGSGLSYVFSEPAGVLTGSGTSRTISAAQTYSVVVTGDNGCTALATTTVQNDTVAPGSASLSASNSGTLTCAVTTLTLTASATGSGLSYAFSGPGTLTGSGASRTTDTPGTYTVVITGGNGCTASATTTISSNTTAPTPTLSANPSSTLTCTQTSLTLTATGGVSYTFAGPGVVSSNATAGTAIVDQAGTYTVTVTSANGCTATSTTVVSQSVNLPTPSLAASGTLTCSITNLTLTATGGNTGATLSYSFSGPGVVSQNASAGTAVVNADGVYSVTVTNTVTGCSSATSTTVTSNTAAPSAGLTVSGTLTCARTAVTLTASGGSPYVFTGTGIVASSGSSATVNQAGTFSVVVTGANGCTAQTSTTVTSNTITPTPGLVASGTITCSVPTVVLTASGGDTYAFSGPGVVTSSGNSATVNLGGVYSVTVTTTSTGCSNSTTATAPSNLTSQAPTVSVGSTGSTVCEGTNVLVAATVGGPITGYQWFKDGVAVGGQTSATLAMGGVTPSQAGSYVLVINSNCGSFTSNVFSLTVNPLPTVTLTVPQGATVVGPGTGVATITLPAPLTGVAMQVFGGTQYERLIILDRINGFEIRQVDSNANGIFTVNRTGPFRLTVTDGNGCKRAVEGTVVTN